MRDSGDRTVLSQATGAFLPLDATGFTGNIILLLFLRARCARGPGAAALIRIDRDERAIRDNRESACQSQEAHLFRSTARFNFVAGTRVIERASERRRAGMLLCGRSDIRARTRAHTRRRVQCRRIKEVDARDRKGTTLHLFPVSPRNKMRY